MKKTTMIAIAVTAIFLTVIATTAFFSFTGIAFSGLTPLATGVVASVFTITTLILGVSFILALFSIAPILENDMLMILREEKENEFK
jgi:hypothetical protein